MWWDLMCVGVANLRGKSLSLLVYSPELLWLQTLYLDLEDIRTTVIKFFRRRQYIVAFDWLIIKISGTVFCSDVMA